MHLPRAIPRTLPIKTCAASSAPAQRHLASRGIICDRACSCLSFPSVHPRRSKKATSLPGPLAMLPAAPNSCDAPQINSLVSPKPQLSPLAQAASMNRSPPAHLQECTQPRDCLP